MHYKDIEMMLEMELNQNGNKQHWRLRQNSPTINAWESQMLIPRELVSISWRYKWEIVSQMTMSALHKDISGGILMLWYING
jgi:hypothetical protein